MFKVNDNVLIASLKKKGLIVEVLNNSKFRVIVGTMIAVCEAKDLQKISTEFSTKTQPTKTKQKSYPKTGKEIFKVDLHGLRVVEALAELDKALNQALLQNALRLEVIHGIGSGAIRLAVHQHLNQLQIGAEFKVSETNPGTTWVYLN